MTITEFNNRKALAAKKYEEEMNAAISKDTSINQQLAGPEASKIIECAKNAAVVAFKDGFDEGFALCEGLTNDRPMAYPGK